MHENRPDASDLRGLESAGNRIAQETLAKTPAMIGPVNGEALEKHHRHLVRHVAPDSPWRLALATAPVASA